MDGKTYMKNFRKEHEKKIVDSHLEDMEKLTSKEKGVISVDEIKIFTIKKEKED